ncbi:MAG: hypothetical protein HYX41_05905 [Bdellovibrio sp.]|nr:hypothetical protein [Bdellovibrio sp.]
MKRKIYIYLAGSIQKAHETSGFLWTHKDRETLQIELPQFDVHFLNPAFRMDDLSDQKSVFGRDMLQVYSCDIVLVDARDRRGLGVGAEMMWAKMNTVPVITWAPRETHYHKQNTVILGVPVRDFVHPFVNGLSDAVVETLAEAAQKIYQLLEKPSAVHGPEIIADAMKYYQETQLHRDGPMSEMIQSNPSLLNRLKKFQHQK